MSCDHNCKRPPLFPKIIFNRPGLPEIDYRIGSYADMRGHMLAQLDKQVALQAWTHRGADDPGIALLEAAAVVGDILTFYQKHYANEGFLRTARWRDSVMDLVRLLGYRLAPGIGGEASFALTIKGDKPVVVPKGFGFKAQLENSTKPSEFENRAEITAYPHLGTFNLYRPRHTPNTVTGTQDFYLFSLTLGPDDFDIESGDRILLGKGSPSTANPTRLIDAQILEVEETWQAFGKRYVRFTTPVTLDAPTFQLLSYKLGESYRHFGHNAPKQTVSVSGSGTVSGSNINYWRNLHTSTSAHVDPNIPRKDMPLDAEVDHFVPGGWLITEARISMNPSWTAHKYYLVRTITKIENKTFSWGTLSGSSTVLTLNDDLVTVDHGDDHDVTDIRTVTFHEVIGAPMKLRRAHQPNAASAGNMLYFFGTQAELDALDERPLLLAQPNETLLANVTSVSNDTTANATRNTLRQLTLDQPISYADFDHEQPQVTVYGNLVTASEGKSQDEVVLGTGDARKVFQTFALPKPPLTYLLDPTQTPSQQPELDVYVDGILWEQVDTFFNAGPDDKIYIVREDAKGNSFIQTGNGVTGSRLPSGLNNVVAKFRSGNGAYGPLADGEEPKPVGKLKPLDKVFLPAPVVNGDEPESESNARVAAPGKVQSLARLVSLADYEAETLALPNVLKVRADWAIPAGVPLVQLTVLTQSGTEADTLAIRDTMQTYNRCRGTARHPIKVIRGKRRYLRLDLVAGFEPSRREADMITAIKQALGVAGEEGDGIDGSGGLFAMASRRFGQGAHASQVIGAVQLVPGVTWVKLNALRPMLVPSGAVDPADLIIPPVPVVFKVVGCNHDQILALYSAHLVVTLSKDEVVKECG